MASDEQEIRQLVSTWMAAIKAGDTRLTVVGTVPACDLTPAPLLKERGSGLSFCLSLPLL